MSILIKGVELPKDKDISLSITVFGDGLAVIFTEQAISPYERRIVERLYKGEAVPVPTPHGRLIDADALYHEMAKHSTAWEYGEGVGDCIKDLENAPTVIEREE